MRGWTPCLLKLRSSGGSMSEERGPKHFLDTSVAYPLLFSAPGAYKEHLASQLARERCRISSYVQMELRRAHLLPLIDFYFTLDLPAMKTASEAMDLWAERFQIRSLKALLRFLAELFATHRIEIDSFAHKETALRVLGITIKRIWGRIRRAFKVIRGNPTRCGRLSVKLDAPLPKLRSGLKAFADEFTNEGACRSRCKVDEYLLDECRVQTREYVRMAATMKKSHNPKFHAIAEVLRLLHERSRDACTCKRCTSVGDAVIALQAPRDMCLEHVDRSFDKLCPPLGQPHRRHLSRSAFYNTLARPKPPNSTCSE